VPAAPGIAVDGDDLGSVDKAIDQGGGAGGAGHDAGPVAEAEIGCDDGCGALVAAGDDREQQVGLAVGEGHVAEFVDDQEMRAAVAPEAAAEAAVAVDGGEFGQHRGGVGEADGVAADQGLVGEVGGDGGLSGAARPDQDDVGRGGDEVGGHQARDGAAVAAARPGPVEVGERLEARQAGLGGSPREAARAPLLLLPGDDAFEQAGLVGELAPVGEQAVQPQGLGPRLEGIAPSCHGSVLLALESYWERSWPRTGTSGRSSGTGQWHCFKFRTFRQHFFSTSTG